MSTVSAYVGTSGRVMFFLLGDGTPASIWTSQASDPTYRIGDGPAIPLTGRTAYPITAGFGPPYVSYPLAERIEPTDTVTYSAPAGWVSFGASDTASAATDAPVTNQSGAEMFPITEPITMRLGMNIGGPHPTQTVDVFRNMLKHTNGGGGVVTSDTNFNPTQISGDAWWNTQNRITSNGIDGRYTGGVVGTYWVTWDDYSPGRDKLAWPVAHDVGSTLITAVGSKLTIATTGSYTRYRQQYDIQFAPGRPNDALGFNTFFNSVDVKNIEVVGPGEDPDSTKVSSAYFRSVLAGVSCLRFMQSGQGLDSNAAIHAHCRQRADISTGLVRYQEAQLAQVEPIVGTHTIRWNGETFSVDKYTLMFPGTDPTFFVGLLCTTAQPHGFYTLQNLDLRGIYNTGYSKPTDATDHCGVQVNGISGPIWMAFHQESQVICYVVDDTHFIVYPGFIVQTAGVADPVGTQTFDISNGRSVVSTFFPRIGNISFADQIRIAGENGSDAQIHISECMTDQGVDDIAAECRDEMIAMGADAPPFVRVVLANEVWNSSWSAFNRLNALSKVVNQNVDRGIVPGSIRQCHAYLAGRVTQRFWAVFDVAGMGDRVKRTIEFQRFGDVELQYAHDHGITFDAGGPSAYYFSTFPAGSWEVYDSVEQWHDSWEWDLQYVVQGQTDFLLGVIAENMPGMELVAYEGGEDQITPGPTYDGARMTDWYYHWRNYRTTKRTFANAQRAGYSLLNLFQWQGGTRTDAGTMWQHSMNGAQQPGLGIDPPNLTVATKGPTDNIDLRNQNPKLLATRDWATDAPSPTPTPTPTHTPTLRRIFVDPDRLSVIIS